VDGLADKSRLAVIGNRPARFCPAAIAAAVSPQLGARAARLATPAPSRQSAAYPRLRLRYSSPDPLRGLRGLSRLLRLAFNARAPRIRARRDGGGNGGGAVLRVPFLGWIGAPTFPPPPPAPPLGAGSEGSTAAVQWV
jgi:hypothetical protein